MGIYEELGLEPIINASGTVTRLGGPRMPASVLEAFVAAAEQWVPLEQLQAAASRVIGGVTGADAGLVTAGSAAALTLGTAAIMTGFDLRRIESLPHCDDFPCEIVVAREHRNGYDHAVRAAGARLVEVGFNEVTAGAGVRRTEAWEYEAAFSERTAGVFYVYTGTSQPPLEEVVQRAAKRKLPVLVDAAGELPPRSNLRLASATGADLVAYSGGKAIRGPQSTGILCGRQDLIGAAALQMLDMDDHFELWDPPPNLIDKKRLSGIPRHGIGRAMKVSKEQIVAMLSALSMFAKGEYAGELQAQQQMLAAIQDQLAGTPATCQLIESDGERSPVLEVYVHRAGASALEICRRLRRDSPPVYVGHGKLDQGILVVNPVCLTNESAITVGARLREHLSR